MKTAVTSTQYSMSSFTPIWICPEAIEGACDQQRLIRLRGCTAYLSLRWSHKSYCRFCRVLAHFMGRGFVTKTAYKIWLAYTKYACSVKKEDTCTFVWTCANHTLSSKPIILSKLTAPVVARLAQISSEHTRLEYVWKNMLGINIFQVKVSSLISEEFLCFSPLLVTKHNAGNGYRMLPSKFIKYIENFFTRFVKFICKEIVRKFCFQ